MPQRRGLFVTFEGVEGSGKSTQARLLAEALAASGCSAVVVTREPGGTPLGDRIRDVLLDPGENGMEPETEVFLYLASRREHVAKVIVPRLGRGDVVISDRYADASVAYQGAGRGLGTDVVGSLNEIATGGVQPDVTFLLDLDPREGLDRLASRGGRDRIEGEGLEFHQRVRRAYLELAREEPARVVIIDAGADRAQIAAAVLGRVRELLSQR